MSGRDYRVVFSTLAPTKRLQFHTEKPNPKILNPSIRLEIPEAPLTLDYCERVLDFSLWFGKPSQTISICPGVDSRALLSIPVQGLGQILFPIGFVLLSFSLALGV